MEGLTGASAGLAPAGQEFSNPRFIPLRHDGQSNSSSTRLDSSSVRPDPLLALTSGWAPFTSPSGPRPAGRIAPEMGAVLA